MTIENLQHRFEYHPPSNEAVALAHADARAKCLALAMHLDARLPDSREKSTVMTKLEEVLFWANAAIARTQDAGPS